MGRDRLDECKRQRPAGLQLVKLRQLFAARCLCASTPASSSGYAVHDSITQTRKSYGPGVDPNVNKIRNYAWFRGRFEGSDLGRREFQRRDEQRDRTLLPRSAKSALERGDGLDAHLRSLGGLSLRKLSFETRRMCLREATKVRGAEKKRPSKPVHVRFRHRRVAREMPFMIR